MSRNVYSTDEGVHSKAIEMERKVKDERETYLNREKGNTNKKTREPICHARDTYCSWQWTLGEQFCNYEPWDWPYKNKQKCSKKGEMFLRNLAELRWLTDIIFTLHFKEIICCP